MEDIVQRVFSILIAVIIFFLLPLYIAFEKKDDIAYALALKLTNSFVDNVAEKGYLTEDMYNDFIGKLSTTGNVYDIKMEYTAKQYSPVIQIRREDGSIFKEFDYSERRGKNTLGQLFQKYDNPNTPDKEVRNIFYIDDLVELTSKEKKSTAKAEISYKLSERKYFTEQILEYISGENNNFVSSTDYTSGYYYISNLPEIGRIYGLADEGILLMNKGDQFSITIRNTNTTIASMLFNTLTFGANSGNDTKVYINYGGTIKNQEYKVDLIGDVNNDGIVNKTDKNIIDDYANKNKKEGIITVVQKVAADINKDGKITNDDVNAIENLNHYRNF